MTYIVRTTIKDQLFTFVVAIMMNLKHDPESRVQLNGRYQTKFYQMNLIPGLEGRVPLSA